MIASVSFHHEPSRKEYPGRCADISHGGLMMYVPASTPIQVGHCVRLMVGSIDHPAPASLGQDPIDAIVVRVERRTLLSTGTVAVGVRFVNEQAG